LSPLHTYYREFLELGILHMPHGLFWPREARALLATKISMYTSYSPYIFIRCCIQYLLAWM